jgi:spore coat polysaccharide biosynthesis protein SpsF
VRIGGLVRARMTSERLPGKALVPIAGRPAILHLLERMAACEYLEPGRTVLCTTTDTADDPLADAVLGGGFRVFRGNRLDVIDRLYQAAREHGFDAVVQVDGDDVCVDPGYMTRVVDRLLLDDETDVVLATGLPLGVAAKAIRFRAFERVIESYCPGDNSTGGFAYFTKTGLCKVAEIGPASEADVHERARLTLDEPEDLEFFRQVFERLYAEGEVFGVAEIVDLLRREPELVEINEGLSDRYDQRTARIVRDERLRFRRDGEIVEVGVD